MSVNSLHINSQCPTSGQNQAHSRAATPALRPMTAAGLRQWRYSFIILLMLPLTLAQHHAEEEPHFLQNQVLCADTNSVMIVLENVDVSRANAVKPGMAQSLTSSLRNALRKAGVAASFPESCASSKGYVAIFARVTLLDEEVYKHYGNKPFGYALSVQVGNKADLSYLVDHNVLSDLQFMAFDEQISSEKGRAALPFERHIVTRATDLIEQLVQTWKEDNP